MENKVSCSFLLLLVVLLISTGAVAADLPVLSTDGLRIIDRVKFYPAPGHEKDMVGGKFTGSNTDLVSDFIPLAEIKDLPATNAWTDLHLDSGKPYRFVRYESPPGSHGRIAELEFYSGDERLKGTAFSSTATNEAPGLWRNAFDTKLNTIAESIAADGQYIGMDFLELASCRKPVMNPGPGQFSAPIKLSITSPTKGTIIRYTTDGTIPTLFSGEKYEAPIAVTHRECIQAVALKNDVAASPISFGVYQVGEPKLSWQTLHVGNSLTASTRNLPLYASTLGIKDQYRSFLHGGATTKVLWVDATGPKKEEWDKALQSFSQIDHFTLQPRDFNIEEEADYDQRFLKVVREKCATVEPWLYAEWVEFARKRPTDLGKEPTAEMTRVWPALTWEESMAAMVLYVEDLQKKLAEQDPDHKPPRIIPSALAMAWMHRFIDDGKVPLMPPGSFHGCLFADSVHPNAEGCYLVDLTWTCAFSGKPAKGALPMDTRLTSEQAKIMQDLSWDVVKNYPGSGWFDEGTRKVKEPQLRVINRDNEKEVTTVALASKTPGAWFRYTLDGTEPSRTRGYVYCGVISLRPDMQLKAVAYKSGMADSPIVALKWH
jgi:hypothetical protein